MVEAALNGLINGAIYGLVAIGLVLVYKGARVFNFAQGEFGTMAVFAAYLLSTTDPVSVFGGAISFTGPGAPIWLAIPFGLLVAVGLGLAVERVIVRPLLDRSRVILLVATAGLAIGLASFQLLAFEAEPRRLPPFIGGEPFFPLGVTMFPQHVLILLTLATIAIALYLFFTRTYLGLAVLATSQDQLATRLVGISTNRMSAFVWGFAAFLGGLAGLLQAPVTFFYPGFMTTTVLLPAFTAAVLGGMTSLPGAFVGGLAVGVARNIGDFIVPDFVTGAGELTVFLLL
ncbi:MAG: branched-chain amino acid ABC transporter permease, partial [Actinomycetota bacterium]|nr:branched-chain amino acid ABC transporter permease [Actinomycetota bacterium]